VKQASSHVKKMECLDLPPLVKKTLYVSLSPSQDKLYQAMKKHLVAEYEGGHCVARLAITKLIRLQEIVSGFITVENNNSKTKENFKNNPRAEALKELLIDITPQAKVAIWSVFKKNYETIRQVCASLDLRMVEVNGELSHKKKFEAVEEFTNNPAVRVFSGHPGSGGIGINLVSASYSIFYSRGFSLEYDVQAEARTHRAGSERHEKVTRIDLVAPGTIDEIISEKLRAKQRIGEEILGELIEELKGEQRGV